MTVYPVAAGGYLLDIAGALTLASAYMFKCPKNIHQETRSYYGGNPFLGSSLAKQTADAWVGGLLLALGFLGRIPTEHWSCAALGGPVGHSPLRLPLIFSRGFCSACCDRGTSRGLTN